MNIFHLQVQAFIIKSCELLNVWWLVGISDHFKCFFLHFVCIFCFLHFLSLTFILFIFHFHSVTKQKTQNKLKLADLRQIHTAIICSRVIKCDQITLDTLNLHETKFERIIFALEINVSPEKSPHIHNRSDIIRVRKNTDQKQKQQHNRWEKLIMSFIKRSWWTNRNQGGRNSKMWPKNKTNNKKNTQMNKTTNWEAFGDHKE